ncbi:uncharacterized protein B0P05DRAFT_553068 [Gilbertella persicaria]|uniref:uncharacterized protein n=1 Tax=Gilbertella persicaria TaxID=101096 RepID=UPI00221E3B7B|nr:uncharacterized protein B0P05DRAFT_553068 [Gilbertella persicaria]KAI8066979.1 hypothetical protein B0P05DRAFT_553068 [Gilbertella persicaria]
MMLTYSSYNSYILASNSLLLMAFFLVNYYATAWNMRALEYVLSLRLVVMSERIVSMIAFINIWYASRGIANPFLSFVAFPVKQYYLTAGPLSTALEKFVHSIRSESISNKPTPSVPSTPTTPVVNEESKEEAFMKLFSSPQNKPQKQPSYTLPHAKPKTGLEPDHSFHTVFNQMLSATTDQSSIQQRNVAQAELRQLFTNDAHSTCTKPITMTNNLVMTEQQQEQQEQPSHVPKLQYTPCVRPPIKPSQHRERLLWFLSPTAEVVEDFRIEQMIQFQQNWHKFNDRTSRVHYDKMTDILLSKIFKPLAESIHIYNEILASTGRNLANCPPSTAMFSLMMPHTSTIAFNIPEIENFININGYANPEGRQYVMDRIKELASSHRMAAYRFTPKAQGMPTDAQIIIHIFTHYLSIKEPYAIPPLVPVEGDLFKFLLIYVKITPELDHWRL